MATVVQKPTSFTDKLLAGWKATARQYGLPAWVALLLKITVALAILEGGTRLMLAVKARFDSGLPECFQYVKVRCRTPQYMVELSDVVRFDMIAGVGHVPNYHGEWITTNSLGFRGPEVSPTPAPGVRRVVVLGGSAVWGASVRDSETIPAYLQPALEKELGQPVEVVNAGVTAATSFEELLRLQAYVLPLHPDIVVVYDGRNDLHFAASPVWDANKTPAVQNFEASVVNAQSGTPSAVLEQLWQTCTNYSAFCNTIQLLSRAWLGARQRAVAQAAAAAAASGETGVSQEVVIHYEVVTNYETNLKRMAVLMKAEGVRPVFVLQPILQPGAKPPSPEEAIILEQDGQTISAVLYPRAQPFFDKFDEVEPGVMALDYTYIFKAVTGQMFFDDVHTTPTGNAYVAGQLAKDIAAALKSQP